MLQLHRNGTVISRIFSLHGRFLHLFSTSTSTAAETPKSIADYLVNSLGFSKEQAIATSLKVRYPNSNRNPNSVVDFFKQNGFHDTHIRKIVSKNPNVLRCDVDKTLKPKFRVLNDLGLLGSDLGDFLANCRPMRIIGLSTDDIDLLTLNLGTKENVIKFLKNSYWSFSGYNDIVTRNITLLRNYGVSSERLQKFVVRYPSIIQTNPEKLKEICARVEQKMGFPVESPTFLLMIYVFCSHTTENLDLKFQTFKSYGLTESDISNMIRRLPQCLNLSEVTIRSKLEFLVKKLGLEAGYIASRPTLLNFSLEKRSVPRSAVLQVLRERKLIRAGLSLYTALKISESQFLNKFVIPYKDELPGLYEAYSNNKMDSFSRSC